MKEGRIIKLIGGQYTVADEQHHTYVLKPRGLFRHFDVSPKVGDMVRFNETTITEVFERKNELVRPPIANIDQAILIHSAKSPEFSFHLLDRFLVLVEAEDIEPVIVVSKIDLLEEDELTTLKKQLSYYQQYYDVYYTTVQDKASFKTLTARFKDRISVFAGQTGSGKSSLLNAIDLKLNIETGEISKALGRGRHTTRHSELLQVYEGLVADTPGFSKLDFSSIDIEFLPMHYPDFFALSDQCKFRGCHHVNEPDCAIKKAVEEENILLSRYQNYLLIYDEIKQQKKKY